MSEAETARSPFGGVPGGSNAGVPGDESATPLQEQPPTKKKGSELGTRLVLGPLMLALIGGLYWADTRGWAGHPGRLSALALGLLALGGVLEYAAMMRKGGFSVWTVGLVAVTAGLCGYAPFMLWESGPGGLLFTVEIGAMVLAAFALLVPMCFLALTKSRMHQGLEMQGATLLGLVLIVWPMFLGQGICMLALPSLLYVVLVCKGGDIGGYLVGMSLGKHKLIPHISPGKTIEGALGSLAVSLTLAVVLRPVLLEFGSEPSEALLSVPWAIAAGILLNVATQSGDLVESLLKRRCGVKDSSTLLPAHGGILDLVDSLLLALPVWFVILLVRL